MMVSSQATAKLEEEIACLGDLPREDLVGRWTSLYKAPPPKGISRALLIRAIAYRMQAKRWGSLKRSAIRRLQEAAARLAVDTNASGETARTTLKPGARLIREWNGKTHLVEVLDRGFLWNGQQHRSLSAIARAITGARWSGPRFFGLGGRIQS